MVSSQHVHFLHFIADVFIMPPTHPPHTHTLIISMKEIERSKICMKILLKMGENWAADLWSPPLPPQPHQKLQNLMHLSGLGDYSGCEASQPCGPLPHQILGHEICHSSCLHCAQGGSGKHALTGPHFSCTAAPFRCSNTAKLLFPL